MKIADMEHPAADHLDHPVIEHLKKEFGGVLDGPVTRNANEVYMTVTREALPWVCEYLHHQLSAPLATIVGTDERQIDGTFKLSYVFSLDKADLFVVVRAALGEAVTPGEMVDFPSVTPKIPAANWYEREVRDMLGLAPAGHPDPERLVLHRDWPLGVFPLRKDCVFPSELPRGEGVFSFRKVDGEGIFQIPVGPVHAGIIEPGHFRFSAVGDTIVNLEARLFYTHRGVEKHCEGQDYRQVVLVAERLCGACAFSHSLAYCQAVERIAGVEAPPRALHIRTVFQELERLYNHIGDVGNICAGIGFALGTAHGSRLKERLMGLNETLAGNRFLRGVNVVGGVRRDISPETSQEIAAVLRVVDPDFRELVEILMSTDSYLDRVTGTGVLGLEVARDLGVVGPAARATGIDRDTRREHPYAAYGKVNFQVPVYAEGDVLARVKVRIDEVFESIGIIQQALEALPDGPLSVPVGELPAYRHALGYVESPRGEDIHWVMTGPQNTIYRYMARSASYCNWPAVPFAVRGNIVPDFPLINKSFELCYSCLDR